ncbi:MAG: hypothetical protein KIT16_08015 [Rhodospirillaceae bacterium]|nr:hypothetical protein [Rhodospirillaceae bacterium]
MAITRTKPAAAPRAATSRKPGGVSVHALDDAPWRELGRKGVKDKSVRRDAATGHYLGVIAFEPMSRSGLHQHLGTALSYFLAGSLCDYQGSASEGMAGINLAGATHDAVSYTGCLIASRLEGPVVVPEGVSAAHPIHGGVREGRLVNPMPERWPDINIAVDPLPLVPTAFAGIGRRMVFDYTPTPDRRRFAAITIMPHAPAVEIVHEGLTDWYVLAGDVSLDGKRAYANSFVIIEPGARVAISSEYGCQLLCWADAPGRGEARGAPAEFYGF